MNRDGIAAPVALKGDLLTGMEWTPAQVREFFRLAGEIKSRPADFRGALAGRFIALIFEKPSLRTRVTFEVGIGSMGGNAIFLDHTLTHLGQRESVRDIAKNLERWVQGLVARVFSQEALEEMAASASIPVINALSDKYHPSQAFADFFTLQERFGDLTGFKFAYIGDGNNMCHSLMSVGARAGAHVRVATPEGYEPDPAIVAEAKQVAKETHGKIELFHSPEEAVAGAQAIYTDVWASMGQEEESTKRERDFAGYQVNERLFSHAAPEALFMHCLPAHRGLEVSAAVIDSPRSVVYDEAENRLHIQKAILHTLLT